MLKITMMVAVVLVSGCGGELEPLPGLGIIGRCLPDEPEMIVQCELPCTRLFTSAWGDEVDGVQRIYSTTPICDRFVSPTLAGTDDERRLGCPDDAYGRIDGHEGCCGQRSEDFIWYWYECD